MCPHHDTTQSNGVPRSADFDKMIGRHSLETGICIDDQAALVIDGDSFRVVSSDVAGKSDRVTKKSVGLKGEIKVTVFHPFNEMRPLRDLVE